MDLKQLLNMLQGVSGPNSSGEYTAKCPAHQDRTASLTATTKQSPKDGKERIYLCCHAGCAGGDIMAALGITAKDLIVNPDPVPAVRSSGKTPAKKKAKPKPETVAGMTVHTVEKDPAQDGGEKKTGDAGELVPDWDHPDRIYSYTDENGQELFQRTSSARAIRRPRSSG